MAVYVGVDIGTTSTKTVAYDKGGRLLARASEGYALRSRNPGWAEQDRLGHKPRHAGVPRAWQEDPREGAEPLARAVRRAIVLGWGHMEQELRSNPALTRSVLGTDDPREVACALDSFCAAHLGCAVRGILSCEISVGAAFGLLLRDGRRAFLKANPPARQPDFLRAVHRTQGHLARHGFPCPRPLVGPRPFLSGHATVDEYADEGSFRDAHDPAVRRKMARALARQVSLCSTLSGVEALADGGMRWPRGPEDGLWPEPHNALFDFGATAGGTGWIDGIALAAMRGRPGTAGRVVGHRDWSAKHFRFEDGVSPPKIRAVYDWDALGVDREPVFAGFAAATLPPPGTWRCRAGRPAPGRWGASSPSTRTRAVGPSPGPRGKRPSARRST